MSDYALEDFDLAGWLAESREYMEKHGWCTEKLVDATGSVCSVGAIMYSHGIMDGVRDARVAMTREALEEVLQDMGVSEWDLVDWNDDQTEIQPVLDLFAKAEKIARAGYDPDA